MSKKTGPCPTCGAEMDVRAQKCRQCYRGNLSEEEKQARKNERNRLWKEANREKVRESGRLYMRERIAADREAHNECQRQWRARNTGRAREIARKAMKKYRDNNPELVREQARQNRYRLRREILAFFGGKCQRCGFEDWRALQIDHINGGGCRDRVTFGGARKYWQFRAYLQEHPEEARQKYQCLCANCNWIKRFENNEHAHYLKD